jgi:myo-inositol 2-dehydrogenase / D-chiro-inositol 1-dehydrogenase
MKQMDKKVGRRGFLKSALGTAALFTIVPRRVLGGPGYIAPSDEITKAVIGTGGMGHWHLTVPGSRLVAVCDVDDEHMQSALRVGGQGVKGYHDFRELLERRDIDVVHIATPPHWHALISIAAAKAGKDIWCEKPMTRTIAEGQKVIDAVQQNGRIFRINTWFRFQDQFYGFGTTVQPIKKLIDSGLLGWPLKVTVSEANGFTWKAYWVGKTDLKPEWTPDCLDYDLWLGPAPYKPYSAHRVHGTFRGYWDYDGGGMGDMGQHYLDPVQYLLGKDDTSPVLVEVDADQQHPDAVGVWRKITLTYADGCQIVIPGAAGQVDDGVPFIEGPKGKLFKGFRSDIPNVKEKLREFPEPASQVTDFYQAVRTRTKFALNEENGHRSATLVNMSKIAWQLGRTLKFDPVQQRFVGDEAANRLVDQPMRAPWHL